MWQERCCFQKAWHWHLCDRVASCSGSGTLIFCQTSLIFSSTAMMKSNVWALCCIYLPHIKKMAKHSATFIPIICSLFYLGQWTSRRQPPGAWWKTRSRHRRFILYFYVPDNALSVLWIAAPSGFDMTLHHTCNSCTISTLSDRWTSFLTEQKNILNSCALRLRWRRHVFPFLGHL